MRHIILTRFNSPIFNFSPTEDWLQQRFELFVNFTLPSITQQTVDNFEYMILLAYNSPKWLIEKFEGVCNQYPGVQFLLLESSHKPPISIEFHRSAGNEFRNKLEEKIKQIVPLSDLPLITTRVDSDDIIAADFVEHIQECVFKDDGFLMFPCGYYICGSLVREVQSFFNPFATWIDTTSRMKTAFWLFHSRIQQQPHELLSQLPMWCWNQHKLRFACEGKQFKEPSAKCWRNIKEVNIRPELYKFLDFNP